jgi:adenine-specific DNA-methyltransferase
MPASVGGRDTFSEPPFPPLHGGVVSRLSDLIGQAKQKDTQLGADLEREFKAISGRVPFGLNFESGRDA